MLVKVVSNDLFLNLNKGQPNTSYRVIGNFNLSKTSERAKRMNITRGYHFIQSWDTQYLIVMQSLCCHITQ